MAAPIRLDEITATEWQPARGSVGAIVEDDDDVGQCIRAILETPRGSVPLRVDFGSDLWQLIDAPLDVARQRVIPAVLEAVERWEPRAEIIGVDVEGSADGALRVLVSFRRRGSATPAQLLPVTLAPAVRP